MKTLKDRFFDSFFNGENTPTLSAEFFGVQEEKTLAQTKKPSRKDAALAIMADYNNYEARPVSFKTIYNRIFWENGAWHLIGHAHNYTAA